MPHRILLSSFLPAASKTARSPRPPYVFLRVGQVVMERKGHMVGVVVSWDPEMRAPQQWVDRMYSNYEVGRHNSTHHFPFPGNPLLPVDFPLSSSTFSFPNSENGHAKTYSKSLSVGKLNISCVYVHAGHQSREDAPL